MEYVEHDLLGLMQSSLMHYSKWLSIDAIRWICYQMFSALSYIHSRDIIHRDLKPSNLLITSQCDVRLADFGLSRRMIKSFVRDYSSNVITLWYRPPELLLGVTNYGPEVDIWSAGCILGELLVGSSLFQNYSNDDIQHLQSIFHYCGSVDNPFQSLLVE